MLALSKEFKRGFRGGVDGKDNFKFQILKKTISLSPLLQMSQCVANFVASVEDRCGTSLIAEPGFLSLGFSSPSLSL